MAEAGAIQSRFYLGPSAVADDAKVVLRDAQVAYLAGMVLECFRKPANKSDLRTRLTRSMAVFASAGIGRSDLHPLVSARADLGIRCQVAV